MSSAHRMVAKVASSLLAKLFHLPENVFIVDIRLSDSGICGERVFELTLEDSSGTIFVETLPGCRYPQAMLMSTQQKLLCGCYRIHTTVEKVGDE